MRISIEGHHYQVSEATRTYVQSGLEKLERFYSPIIDCHVTLKEVKETFSADLIVRVQGQTLKSANSDTKLYKAVDEAIDKMIRQLQKLHDKRRSHRPAVSNDSAGVGE